MNAEIARRKWRGWRWFSLHFTVFAMFSVLIAFINLHEGGEIFFPMVIRSSGIVIALHFHGRSSSPRSSPARTAPTPFAVRSAGAKRRRGGRREEGEEGPRQRRAQRERQGARSRGPARDGDDPVGRGQEHSRGGRSLEPHLGEAPACAWGPRRASKRPTTKTKTPATRTARASDADGRPRGGTDGRACPVRWDARGSGQASVPCPVGSEGEADGRACLSGGKRGKRTGRRALSGGTRGKRTGERALSGGKRGKRTGELALSGGKRGKRTGERACPVGSELTDRRPRSCLALRAQACDPSRHGQAEDRRHA